MIQSPCDAGATPPLPFTCLIPLASIPIFVNRTLLERTLIIIPDAVSIGVARGLELDARAGVPPVPARPPE